MLTKNKIPLVNENLKMRNALKILKIGQEKFIPQDNSKATYAKKINNALWL